ncbi:MAG: porin [Gemmatimonadaceae bacterium]
MVALTTAGSVASAQTSGTVASAQTTSAPATDAKAAIDSTPKTAAPAADSTPNFFRDIQANAFLSFGIQTNLNQPDDRSVGLRYFDNVANSFSLDVAEIVLQKAVKKPGDAGFRVDFTAGSTIPGKAQSAGLRIGESADLQQAFFTYLAPVGSGLKFDIGKFVTHLGYELIEGYDGYNDNYSRSLLFNYAIPLTHTGVKVGYTVNSMVSVTGMVVNGWDNALDNNSGKSIGAQIALTPAPPVAIYLNYMGGPELTDTNKYLRHIGDFIATYKVSDAAMLGINADYGMEENASLVKPGDDAKWYGVAGYGRFGPATGLSVGLRAETFKDDGGSRLGSDVPVSAKEFTITPVFKFANNFAVRAEFRYDSVNEAIFTDDKGKPKKSQATLGLNAVWSY